VQDISAGKIKFARDASAKLDNLTISPMLEIAINLYTSVEIQQKLPHQINPTRIAKLF
jgi:hypothetical protein